MDTPAGRPLHWPSLLTALAIMVVGTVYPPLLTTPDGHADHRLAGLVFWAMAAGFVHGVGFAPRFWLWRWLLSGWSCGVALALAISLKWLH